MQKPSVLALLDRGLTLITGDLSGPIDALADAIAGHDTLISAISAPQQLAQLALVDAAAKAGIKRFVPCGFTIVCPPTGVMHLRSNKEVVYQRVLYHHLPYTIVDVGYWHQLSWFRVPSGRLDYALMMERNAVYGDGEAETLLTDKRDIGRFVTRIIKDPRTLNQKVVTYSDALSQNQIVRMIEEKTGEKLQVTHVRVPYVAERIHLSHLQTSLALTTPPRSLNPSSERCLRRLLPASMPILLTLSPAYSAVRQSIISQSISGLTIRTTWLGIWVIWMRGNCTQTFNQLHSRSLLMSCWRARGSGHMRRLYISFCRRRRRRGRCKEAGKCGIGHVLKATNCLRSEGVKLCGSCSC